MDDTAEFYLASIWKYREAGAKRVLNTLRVEHPGNQFQFAFESDENWFHVRCGARDVQDVQATFHAVHEEIERGLEPGEFIWSPTTKAALDRGNRWLKAPSPTELPPATARVDAGASVGVGGDDGNGLPFVDHLCPARFDQCEHSRVWARVKTETPDTIAVQAVVSEDDRRSIMASSGAHLAFDVTGRLIYLGAPTRACLDAAVCMLDNMFNKFLTLQVFIMPSPKHILYAETEGPYHVDARLMAHVNDTMLTSTIFDPGQYSGTHLDRMFRDIFAKAACLRICLVDRFKRTEVSFFGPKLQPIFSDQARRWPMWFRRATYTPRNMGGAASRNMSKTSSPGNAKKNHLIQLDECIDREGKGKDKAVGTNADAGALSGRPVLDGPLDLLGDNIPSPQKNSLSMLALMAVPTSRDNTASTVSGSELIEIVPYGTPAVKLLPFEPANSGYQMEMARLDSRPFVTHGIGSGNKVSPWKEQPHVSLLDDEPPLLDTMVPWEAEAVSGQDSDALLIDVCAPPLPGQCKLFPVCQERPRERDSSSVKSMGKALSRRTTTFAKVLCQYIGRLMADLAYSRGRIRLKVEVGRIYIMDASPEGLASNGLGEPASGWLPAAITSRLDAICVSPSSIVFTKALTLFANDIEQVLGYGVGASVSASTSASMVTDDWTLHERRVIYDLKCQRYYNTSDGVVKAQSPFVVEVEDAGAVAGAGIDNGGFSYALRSVEDTRPPIWIHCIRRHWDARVVVSYSQTDELEAAYGDFARGLLKTMVIPPCPMTNPRFQVAYDHSETRKDGCTYVTKVLSARVRNVGRFVSADQASFLDVSWNWHMVAERRADDVEADPLAHAAPADAADPAGPAGLVGTMRFTAAEEDPAHGVFSSWYEASVVSAAAEAAFRENETLRAGDVAAWGGRGGGGSGSSINSSSLNTGNINSSNNSNNNSKNENTNDGKFDEMCEAAFGPALRLVQKMDGVGVLIDNGQGNGLWRPPMLSRKATAQKFW